MADYDHAHDCAAEGTEECRPISGVWLQPSHDAVEAAEERLDDDGPWCHVRAVAAYLDDAAADVESHPMVDPFDRAIRVAATALDENPALIGDLISGEMADHDDARDDYPELADDIDDPDMDAADCYANDTAALIAALKLVDAVWAFDAERGKCDGIGGAEYRRTSPARRLRRVIRERQADHPRTWAERFPEGRVICYEGDDPEGFAADVRERFGFDPSADPRWTSTDHEGAAEYGPDPFGRTHWFRCPAEHLDAVYSDDRYPTGS